MTLYAAFVLNDYSQFKVNIFKWDKFTDNDKAVFKEDRNIVIKLRKAVNLFHHQRAPIVPYN